MPIQRIWHGWTEPDEADAYARLLHDEIFPEIEALSIPGYRSIQLLRRDGDDEVEFVAVMTFDSLENVVAFQGDDYERAYVPETAQRLLSRWNERSSHYEIVETRSYSER